MAYLKEAGKKVPEDIQIAGMGDTPVSRLVEPSLSTVHFFYKTAGMEAATRLVDLLESESTVCKELKMGYEIVLKNSTR